MTALLVVLTLLEIVLVVAVLVFFLVAISRSLRRTVKLLGKVSFGVRAIETQCAPIGPSVLTINDQLAGIAAALGTVTGLAERAAAGRSRHWSAALTMDELHPPKSEMLRTLYWRSEILQVMYWLRGEGLGEIINPPLLERFLGVEAKLGLGYLDQLVEDGYLERLPDGYVLSPIGLEEGKTEFALSFSDMTRPAHGECSADCWCHASVEEALACAAERMPKPQSPQGPQRPQS